MITKITFRRFKQFKAHEIDLGGTGLRLLAGGNNSGKTSLLHGMAVWEFCRAVVEAEKGRVAFSANQKLQGVGISGHEFLPINLPDLSHLWTNLKSQKKHGDQDGYTLRIRCDWNFEGAEKHLEFGLSLANDRLFVRATSSNLGIDDYIPRVAYLPPFAGISSREARVPVAVRRRRVGEGLAGAVLRNTLLDLFVGNEIERKRLRGEKTKISDADLKQLRESDPWEVVQQTLRKIFNTELIVSPFNDSYHSYIGVEVVKGDLSGFKLKRHKGYKPRDLMVEGSGFLQLLSVFSLAVDPGYDVLLLDEPDAHLHAALQRVLLDELTSVAKSKLVLVATHSTEVLKWAAPKDILAFRSGKNPKIVKNEESKASLIAGVGSIYLPRIDAAKETRRILFVEGEGDARVLRCAAEAHGRAWNGNWIIWPEKSQHNDRVRLASALREEIPGLRVISIRDRDFSSVNSVSSDLLFTGITVDIGQFIPITWKRRNIENYLMWPSAIAHACGKTEQEVVDELTNKFGISIGLAFRNHLAPSALLDADGKAVLANFGLIKEDLLPFMQSEWLPTDMLRVLEYME